MKKACACLLLAAVLSISLCGCHGSRGLDAFSMPEGLDESKQYELNFWAKNDTNRTQVDIYEKAIFDFEKLYPNVKINLKLYTDYVRIYNDVITNIATGTTPNVCITYPDHIATYITGNNVVVPLNDLIDDENFGLGGKLLKFDSPKKNEIEKKFFEEGYIGESCYALPYMRSTEACYINKTFVEKLGFEVPDILTWDFIWEVSEAATAKDIEGNYAVNGQKVMIPFIYKSTDNMMIQMLRQKNAPYSNNAGEILLFNDTTRDLLFEISKHGKSGAFSTFKISSYPANFLNAGQCIFAIDSTAGSTWMGTNAPLLDISRDKLVEFETVVRPVPQFDEDNISMISQGPSICVFNKNDSGEVLVSWLFAQFLLTNDVQIAYAQTEGYVPVTEKAVKDPAYRDYLSREGEDNALYYDIKLKATKLLMENTNNTFTTPVFNGSAALRNASGQLIEDVTKSVRRNETVDDAYMTKLFADSNSLYRLDEAQKTAGEKEDLGKLPRASVILLTSLALVWIIIAVFAVLKYNKAKKASGK